MRSTGLVLALLVLGTAAAEAGSYDDFNTGIALRVHDEIPASITYLSRALAAPDLPAHLRAPALLARGLDYVKQKDFAAADKDLTAAITLAPNRISSRVARAYSEEELNDYNAAIEDYTAAISLKRFETRLYAARAEAYEHVGDYADAEADYAFILSYYTEFAFGYLRLAITQWAQGRSDKALPTLARAHDLEAKNGYYALWREIARVSAGQSESMLKSDARSVDTDKWPAPLLDLYLGRSRPEDALAAAEKGDAKMITGQRCEAAFYVAEWHLTQKDAIDVRPLLTQAATACPADYVEYTAAQIALNRMNSRVSP